MTESKPSITRTIHTLPFDKLSPLEFERLCLWLVEREGYKRAEHLGASGSEQGCDIIAWRAGDRWCFQCKRVRRFGPKEALAEVEKVLALPKNQRPMGIVFPVTCNVSTKTRQQTRERCAEEGIECHFWTGTEFDERVKHHLDIVEEFFQTDQDNSAMPSWWRRFRRHPLIFYPTVAFTILATIVGLLASLISMGADIGGARQQLQQWGWIRAFPTEGENELLIVIASFHYSEGIVNTEAHNEIRQAIQEAAKELGFSHLRVGVSPVSLHASDRAKAEKLGNRYDASIVIWGNDTGVRTTVNYLNIKKPNFVASDVQISETRRTQLANPNAYASFITKNLPGQLTFLSLFAVGQSYIIERAFPNSITVIEKAVGSLPKEEEPIEGISEAYYYLGWLYYISSQDYEQSVFNFTKVIELNSDHANAYVSRGSVRFYQDDLDGAIADLNRAIELDPDNSTAYNSRGITHIKLGDLNGAIADYNRCIELDPDHAIAYHNRGYVRRERGDLDGAIADYTRAIELDPDDVSTYYSRGNTQRERGDLDNAITDLTKAIELRPRFANAYNSRGVARTDQNDLDGAIADFTKAIELNPDSAIFYNHRSAARFHQDDLDGAIADLNRAIELDPDFADAYIGRSTVRTELGDLNGAIADLRYYLELRPKAKDREMIVEWIAELEAEISEP